MTLDQLTRIRRQRRARDEHIEHPPTTIARRLIQVD